MERHLFADLRECRACLTCENACRAEHTAGKDPLAAMLKGEATRIFVQSQGTRPIPVMCRHCDEPACVDACLAGAMKRDAATGRVSVDPDACVGCAMCLMACPFGVVLLAHKDARHVAVKCDLCPDRDSPACVDACPQKALVFCSSEQLDGDKRSRLVSACIG